MRIRPMRADDRAAVRDVLAAAFGEHAAKVLDLDDALDAARADGSVPGLALVAEDDVGLVVGVVRTSRGWLDADRSLVEVHELTPLAVHPRRQDEGIGSALVNEVLALAERAGVPLVWLEGEPEYYPRLGFRLGASLGLVRPSARIPEVAFLATRLESFEPWMTGQVVCSDVLWRHDAVGLR